MVCTPYNNITPEDCEQLDCLEIVAGKGILITAKNNKRWIAVDFNKVARKIHDHAPVTTEKIGFMTPEDKQKLADLEHDVANMKIMPNVRKVRASDGLRGGGVGSGPDQSIILKVRYGGTGGAKEVSRADHTHYSFSNSISINGDLDMMGYNLTNVSTIAFSSSAMTGLKNINYGMVELDSDTNDLTLNVRDLIIDSSDDITLNAVDGININSPVSIWNNNLNMQGNKITNVSTIEFSSSAMTGLKNINYGMLELDSSTNDLTLNVRDLIIDSSDDITLNAVDGININSPVSIFDNLNMQGNKITNVSTMEFSASSLSGLGDINEQMFFSDNLVSLGISLEVKGIDVLNALNPLGFYDPALTIPLWGPPGPPTTIQDAIDRIVIALAPLVGGTIP